MERGGETEREREVIAQTSNINIAVSKFKRA